MGSNLTYDSCGICGGDDSSCNKYTGTLEISFPSQGGYQPLLVLPKNARSVRIYEYSKSKLKNYLAIKNLNGNYYLNGQFVIQTNNEFFINGKFKFFKYEHKDYFSFSF